ncbi:MAG: Invasion associated locus B family protein [Candidatus Tokpelaia sp. JSC085]|nr:MAG: Invasion associated locus B family protein [Candidatus Tokpelaia sp. JSC085]
MFWKIFVTTLILIVNMNRTVFAQTPTRLNQFDYWGAYSYNANKNTVCYILSIPTDQAPSTVKHGDNFFLITKRLGPGKTVTFEPQFMAGYNLREHSYVNVKIGAQNFSLFTKGASAWMDMTEGEANLVAAMKAGVSMTVKAISQRGTNTTYTFLLKGVTAAVNAIQKCQ